MGIVLLLANSVTATAQVVVDGVYRIQIQQSRKFLHVDGAAQRDQLASTRIQTNDNYAKFRLTRNADRTYSITCLGNGKLLAANPKGRQLVSTHTAAAADQANYMLEPQDDGTYKIKVKATGRYCHLDGEGSRLMTTAIQFDDGYSRYFFIKQPDNTPQPGPAPMVDNSVNGQNLVSVDVFNGNAQVGVIREIGPQRWEWQEGGNRHAWQEERRTQSSVFLSANDSYIEINISKAGIFGSDRTFRTGAQYYPMRNPVARSKTPMPVQPPVNPTKPRREVVDKPKVDGINVVSFEVWHEGTKEIKKPDGTRYPFEQRRRHKVSEKTFYWYEEGGFWRFDRVGYPPADKTYPARYTVLRKNADELWLQELGRENGFLANFKTGAWSSIYQGKVDNREKDYVVKNPETGYIARPNKPERTITFEPEWYETPDQSFVDLDGVNRGTKPWSEADRDRVPNMIYNFRPYYYPEMHPYKLYETGTTRRSIFEMIDEDSTDYYYEDRSYPVLFFYSRRNSGASDRTGRVFFSESDRQKSFSSSASVSAGGYGVSVGLEGSYGENEASTSSTENSSVFVSSHTARYWLTLNKTNVRLTKKFRELVLTTRNPARFLKEVGSHYPLAVLYGSRAYYDEQVKKQALTTSAGTDWGVGASAEGGAFGVSAAVSASYDQSSSQSQTSSSEMESVRLRVIGGEGVSVDGGTDDPNSMPIKVVLKPIYELIRPELFPGADASIVLSQRKNIEDASNQLFQRTGIPGIGPSRYEQRNGISDRYRSGSIERFKSQLKMIGSPILFTFEVRGLSPVAGSDLIQATDSRNRPIKIVPLFRDATTPDYDKRWFCYLTIVPDVIDNSYYEYYTDSVVTLRGANGSMSVRLDNIKMGDTPRTGRKESGVRNPKYEPGFNMQHKGSGAIVSCYAERAYPVTESGDKKDNLPEPPWTE